MTIQVEINSTAMTLVNVNNENTEKSSPIMDCKLINAINVTGVHVFKSAAVEVNNILISPISAFSSISLINNEEDDLSFEFYNLKRQVESENNNKSYDYSNGNILITDQGISSQWKETMDFYHGAKVHNIGISESDHDQILLKRKVMTAISKDAREELKKSIFNSILQLKLMKQPSLMIGSSYLKGTWVSPFDKMQTEKRTFYNFSQDTYKPVNVDFLCRWNHAFKILRPKPGTTLDTLPKFTTLCLPYKDGLSMIIFTPSSAKDMVGLENIFTTDLIDNIVDDLVFTSLHLTALPKFNLFNCINLSDHLSVSGTFDNLTILHAAGIELSESGTEPVSSKELFKDRTMPSTNRPSVVIDKPFLFAIRQDVSGLIIFLGKVSKLEG